VGGTAAATHKAAAKKTSAKGAAAETSAGNRAAPQKRAAGARRSSSSSPAPSSSRTGTAGSAATKSAHASRTVSIAGADGAPFDPTLRGMQGKLLDHGGKRPPVDGSACDMSAEACGGGGHVYTITRILPGGT
jgi:hypothetical protein